MKDSTKLTPCNNSPAATLPNEVLDAAGLKQSDDGIIEIHHAALVEAFEWSIERFTQTYRDLA